MGRDASLMLVIALPVELVTGGTTHILPILLLVCREILGIESKFLIIIILTPMSSAKLDT